MNKELIKTTKGEFLLLEVPKSCINFTINMGYLIFKSPAYENWVTDDELMNPIKLDKYLKRVEGKEDWKQSVIKIPDNHFRNYQFIAVTESFVLISHEASQNITEDIAAQIVGDNGAKCYDNYRLKKGNKYTCTTAISSFHCLLNACNLPVDNVYAILKVIK